MLTGKRAKFYRTVSKVTVKEISKFIDPDIIQLIESDSDSITSDIIEKHYRDGITPTDIITHYFNAINQVKREKVRKPVEKPIKKATRKPRKTAKPKPKKADKATEKVEDEKTEVEIQPEN